MRRCGDKAMWRYRMNEFVLDWMAAAAEVFHSFLIELCFMYFLRPKEVDYGRWSMDGGCGRWPMEGGDGDSTLHQLKTA